MIRPLVLLFAGPAILLAQTVPRGDDPSGAHRFFVEQRADASGRIPPRARRNAMEQMLARWPQTGRNRRAIAASANFAAATSTTTWTTLGPAPLGLASNPSTGRLTTIAVHPTNPQIIYVGGAQGGVWKTTNGGTTWLPLTDDQCSLAMGSIAIDPMNPQIVYAGTGEENFSGDSYYGCGVLRSTDGGATWTQQGASDFDSQTGGATISRILIDKASAGSIAATVVYAATNKGLYRSPNSGVTWQRMISAVATDIVASPTQSATLFAGIGGTSTNSSTNATNGVYTSTDNGLTWTKLTSGLPTADHARVNLAIAPSDATVIYASFLKGFCTGGSCPNEGSLLGIWKSIDGGANWNKTAATNASCSSQCWYDMVIAVDPASAQTVLFGGFSVYRSLDGANSFSDVGASVHVDHHAIAYDPSTPGTVYVGSDGGIWKSAGSGASGSFTSLNTSLALTQFYQGVSISPISATDITGGTQDNGTVEWGGVSNWPVVIGGDGGYTAIDHRLGTTAYGETQWDATNCSAGPRRRDPNSSSYLLRTSGINQCDRAQFIPPIVMDPTNPSALYFGTYRLYRTGDRASSWSAISPDLSKAGGGTVTAIAPSPVDSLTIFVGMNDGNIQVTSDLGVTWTPVVSGLPSRFVSDFAMDPRDPRIAYVGFAGFVSGSSAGHVFRTTNRGATWTDITFDLPNLPVLALTLQPGSGELDIGTDLGVFALKAGASTWTPLTGGLPNVAVYDLVYDKARGRLIAATHGRGMFSLDVSVSGLRGDITNDGVLSALDAQAILSAVVGLPLPAGAVRFPNGDANCDGDVTAFDALLVLSKVVGLPTGNYCVGTIR